MRKSAILILSLFLILFMSMTAISSADVNIDDTVDINQNDNVLEVSDDSSDIISEDEGNATGGEINVISFAELKNLIRSSSTVNLDSDVEYGPDDSGGIGITKDTVINGNGHTINAKGKTRIFSVPSGISVTINNVSFINGYMSGSSGGAILNSGNIKLNYCNFTNCKVSGSGTTGGAIAGSGSGTISKCNFYSCSATTRAGAISSNGLKIRYCNFEDNSAGFGGAIGGTAYIYYSNFKNCIATASSNYDGGGVGSGLFPKVESSTFTNCKSEKGYGGALRGTTNSYNCEFTNCVAKEGGAIRGKGETVGCTFKKCVATTSMGGAIFTEKSTIDKCTFIKCSSSKSKGGAVFAGNNVKLTNCKFINCTALRGFGGAVYGNGVISKCTFEGNRAKYGGAVSSYSITIKGSTFKANTVTKGGAVYKVKTLASCNFIKNTATYGGAIYDGQKVTSSKFTDNYAKRGAVSYNDVNSVFKKATVKNNVKLSQGLFYNYKHKLTLTYSKIVNKGKFSKYLNYNTGTFIYNNNKLQSSYKVKKIAGPRNVQKR